LWLLLVFAAAMAISVQATTVIIPSDDELIIGSRAIVKGQVTSIGSSYDANQRGFFTYITLRVTEVLKGQITTREVVLKEPGGIAGGFGSMFFGVPQFTVDEQVLLYLDTWQDGSLRVYQWFMGKFAISSDASSGQMITSRAPAEGGVSVLGRSAAGPSTDRMEIGAYTTMIREHIAATRERGDEHEARNFRGIGLRSMPTELSVPGKTPLENFILLNPSQPPRWFEPDSNQPVTFNINFAGAFTSSMSSDVAAAMSAWSNVSGASLRLQTGGSTSSCGLKSDSVNAISFNNCDGYFPAPSGCSGLLGVGGITLYTLSPSLSKVVNGTLFYRALEGDVSLNPAAACYLSEPCQLQEVLTHELGHAVGLGHSDDQTATMNAFAHFDGRCASLGVDDANAIRFIYPGGTTPPPATGTGTITATPNPIQVCDGSNLGVATINWSASGASLTEVHIGSPSGPLFASGVSSGSQATGKWVTNGTVFYLQNVTNGLSLTSGNTIATVTATVNANGCGLIPISATPNPITVCSGSKFGATTITWSAASNQLVEVLAGGALFARSGGSGNKATGTWVGNGLVFSLRDSASGSTLGSVTVNLTNGGCLSIPPAAMRAGPHNRTQR